MRDFSSLRIAAGWLVASMLSIAGHAQAQTGGGCNCAQIVADCSASVSVLPIHADNGAFSADVTLQTNASACAKVAYALDDTPYVTVLHDGVGRGQRLYGTRALTRNSLSHMSCQVCAAATAPVPNDGLPADLAPVDGAPGTYSAVPAGAAEAPVASPGAYTPPASAVPTSAIVAAAPQASTRPDAPGATAPAGAPAALRVFNPSGRWRGLCTNAPPWWGFSGSPMTRLMALALNGAQVTGSVDDVEPNVHTTVQGTLAGARLQLAGSYGAKHDITLSTDGTTLTDAWCNGDGRCETCKMQRF